MVLVSPKLTSWNSPEPGTLKWESCINLYTNLALNIYTNQIYILGNLKTYQINGLYADYNNPCRVCHQYLEKCTLFPDFLFTALKRMGISCICKQPSLKSCPHSVLWHIYLLFPSTIFQTHRDNTKSAH